MAELHDDISQFKYFTRWGGELLACNNNGKIYYYIKNNRGDVVMLVNADGTVYSVRDYDANGQLTFKLKEKYGTGDRDPFGFIGGLNANGNVWKLGSRFYDASKGSFIQQDRYLGDPNDPLSLNRYVYCGLDPVNYVDPNGFSGRNINSNNTSIPLAPPGVNINDNIKFALEWKTLFNSACFYPLPESVI